MDKKCNFLWRFESFILGETFKIKSVSSTNLYLHFDEKSFQKHHSSLLFITLDYLVLSNINESHNFEWEIEVLKKDIRIKSARTDEYLIPIQPTIYNRKNWKIRTPCEIEYNFFSALMCNE